MKYLLRCLFGLVLFTSLTSFVPAKFIGGADIFSDNQLSVSVGFFVESDIDSYSVTYNGGGGGPCPIDWSTPSINMEFYFASVPRGGCTIEIYEQVWNGSQWVWSLHNTITVTNPATYTYVWSNPPAGIMVKYVP